MGAQVPKLPGIFGAERLKTSIGFDFLIYRGIIIISIVYQCMMKKKSMCTSAQDKKQRKWVLWICNQVCNVLTLNYQRLYITVHLVIVQWV